MVFEREWNGNFEKNWKSHGEAMCGVKLVDRKKMEKLMEMLGLKKTLDRMAKAKGVRWYGHVMRRNDDIILKKAMMMEVNEERKRGRPKLTWRRQVEESVKKVGLKIEEAGNRTRWKEGVRATAERIRCIQPPSETRRKPDWNWIEEERFSLQVSQKALKFLHMFKNFTMSSPVCELGGDGRNMSLLVKIFVPPPQRRKTCSGGMPKRPPQW